MKTALQTLAEDIAQSLARELRDQPAVGETPAARNVESLVDQGAKEVANPLGHGASTEAAAPQVLLDRLQQVESALERRASGIQSAYPEGTPAASTALTVEGPKYQNLESLLKYVDGPEGERGVKLVIMNFND